MIWFMVFQVVSTLIELVRLGCQSESERDLEILLLLPRSIQKIIHGKSTSGRLIMTVRVDAVQV